MKLAAFGLLAAVLATGSMLAFGETAHASDWSRATYAGHPALARAATIDPVYKQVYDEVSKDRLEFLLKQLTGYAAADVGGGRSALISERYSPEGKANFRAFWLQYMRDLGIQAE